MYLHEKTDKNELAFEILEDKNMPQGDILNVGESIQKDLDKVADVPIQKLGQAL